MKKIKLFLCVALFGAMSFGAFSAYDYVTMSEDEKFLLANVEALTRREPDGGDCSGWDCNYHRYPDQCRIYVGVKGSIKLFGGSIIKANADGYVVLDGQLSCGGGGDRTCTPVECKDLYDSILN